MRNHKTFQILLLPGFSVAAPWAFNWFFYFLDGNANKVDISIVGTNGKFSLINAHGHGVLRKMGPAMEIPLNTFPLNMLNTS